MHTHTHRVGHYGLIVFIAHNASLKVLSGAAAYNYGKYIISFGQRRSYTEGKISLCHMVYSTDSDCTLLRRNCTSCMVWLFTFQFTITAFLIIKIYNHV